MTIYLDCFLYIIFWYVDSTTCPVCRFGTICIYLDEIRIVVMQMRKDSSYGDVRVLEVGEVGHGKIEVCPVEDPRWYVWCIKDIYIEMVLQNCCLMYKLKLRKVRASGCTSCHESEIKGKVVWEREQVCLVI